MEADGDAVPAAPEDVMQMNEAQVSGTREPKRLLYVSQNWLSKAFLELGDWVISRPGKDELVRNLRRRLYVPHVADEI